MKLEPILIFNYWRQLPKYVAGVGRPETPTLLFTSVKFVWYYAVYDSTKHRREIDAFYDFFFHYLGESVILLNRAQFGELSKHEHRGVDFFSVPGNLQLFNDWQKQKG